MMCSAWQQADITLSTGRKREENMIDHDKRIREVRETLMQYEEGAITFIEFANWCASQITQEDIDAQNELQPPHYPWGMPVWQKPASEDVLIDFSDVIPNWSATWSPAEVEAQLSGFQFKGPGWYFTKTDTILAVRIGATRRHKVWSREDNPDEKFRFHVWNKPNAEEVFSSIGSAPTRVDER